MPHWRPGGCRCAYRQPNVDPAAVSAHRCNGCAMRASAGCRLRQCQPLAPLCRGTRTRQLPRRPPLGTSVLHHGLAPHSHRIARVDSRLRPRTARSRDVPACTRGCLPYTLRRLRVAPFGKACKARPRSAGQSDGGGGRVRRREPRQLRRNASMLGQRDHSSCGWRLRPGGLRPSRWQPRPGACTQSPPRPPLPPGSCPRKRTFWRTRTLLTAMPEMRVTPTTMMAAWRRSCLEAAGAAMRSRRSAEHPANARSAPAPSSAPAAPGDAMLAPMPSCCMLPVDRTRLPCCGRQYGGWGRGGGSPGCPFAAHSAVVGGVVLRRLPWRRTRQPSKQGRR